VAGSFNGNSSSVRAFADITASERNRCAGTAMSKGWCGRRVLYSTAHVSIAACAACIDSNCPQWSNSSR
jgi:hypothetical protein